MGGSSDVTTPLISYWRMVSPYGSYRMLLGSDSSRSQRATLAWKKSLSIAVSGMPRRFYSHQQMIFAAFAVHSTGPAVPSAIGELNLMPRITTSMPGLDSHRASSGSLPMFLWRSVTSMQLLPSSLWAFVQRKAERVLVAISRTCTISDPSAANNYLIYTAYLPSPMLYLPVLDWSRFASSPVPRVIGIYSPPTNTRSMASHDPSLNTNS